MRATKKYSTSIQQQFPDTVFIGVVGHMDPVGEDKLSVQIAGILSDIQLKNHSKLALLCPGAEGADQLVAKCAFAAEIPVIGFKLADYSWSKKFEEVFQKNDKWLKDNVGNPLFTMLDLSDLRFKTDLDNAGSKLNEKNREKAQLDVMHDMLGALSAVIAGQSDYIIALWDGIDNGKPAGTSETVHMALHGKDFNGHPIYIAPRKNNVLELKDQEGVNAVYQLPKGYLYQVVTPRSGNQFPVGKFPAVLWQNVPNAGRFETGITVFPTIPSKGNYYQKLRNRQRKSVFQTSNILNYGLPIILVLVTIGFGSFGFMIMHQAVKEAGMWPSANDFFSAVNLITFDSSKDIDPAKSNTFLELGRWAGLFFILNAFIITIVIAIGKNNKIRFKIMIWNLFRFKYQILMGLTDKSYHLAIDLINKGKRVILIDGDPEPVKVAEAEKQGINVYVGNSYSNVSLTKICAVKARKVYFLHDDDTLNIRSLHELEQLYTVSRNKSAPVFKQFRFIHITDFRYKDFICNNHPDTKYTETQVFNIYENTARRLLMQYPVHRFDKNKPNQHAEVFIFGFGEMAEQILLHNLRTGIYNADRQLKVTVFTTNHEEKEKEFYKKYPALWHHPTENSVYEKQHIKIIRDQVFPEGAICFKELPLSDSAYFSDETLDRAIRSGNVVSLYFCTPLSVQSAAYLQAILPKIAQLQQSPFNSEILTDVQCFCHYNLYDNDEVAYAEHIVNKRIPNSAVIFFGSFVHECTEKAFSQKTDDLLPRLINLWYTYDRSITDSGVRKPSADLLAAREEFWIRRSKAEDYREKDMLADAERLWMELSPINKLANYFAADHLWVKLYLMGQSYATVKKNLEAIQLNGTARSYLYVPENPQSNFILEMAIVEHRRWCAERLMEGFLTFQDIYPEQAAPAVFPQVIKNWNNKELPFKSHYQNQKQHIDLLPFDELYKGDIGDLHYDEKVKDIALIEAIPYLIDKV